MMPALYAGFCKERVLLLILMLEALLSFRYKPSVRKEANRIKIQNAFGVKVTAWATALKGEGRDMLLIYLSSWTRQTRPNRYPFPSSPFTYAYLIIPLYYPGAKKDISKKGAIVPPELTSIFRDHHGTNYTLISILSLGVLVLPSTATTRPKTNDVQDMPWEEMGSGSLMRLENRQSRH
ncbi:hypothetical protein F5H01DRAFT_323983 [Linnemannia elongata]|nr:hypothetical protein F5H01DRAFT_323983 [Linnemannia elongata]